MRGEPHVTLGAPPDLVFPRLRGLDETDRRLEDPFRGRGHARAETPSEGRVTRRGATKALRGLPPHGDGRRRSPPRHVPGTLGHRSCGPRELELDSSATEPVEASLPTTNREARRHPRDRGAFHRLQREQARVDRSTWLLCRPPTHAARTLESALDGHCKHPADPRGSAEFREDERLYNPPRSRLTLTGQACRKGSVR